MAVEAVMVLLLFACLQISIPRGYLGYGFTVKGALPVRVGRVKEGGAAEDAGLRDSDVILRINSVDVTRATTEHVAELIRTSAKKISLDVRRQHEQHEHTYESIISDGSVVTHGNASSTPVSKGNKHTYENAGYERHQDDTCESYVPWQPHLSVIKEESNVINTPDMTSPNKSRRKSYNKWAPDISEISTNMMTSLIHYVTLVLYQTTISMTSL